MLLIGAAAGYLKWQEWSLCRASKLSPSNLSLLQRNPPLTPSSYQLDSVERDLDAARDGLTGKFQGLVLAVGSRCGEADTRYGVEAAVIDEAGFGGAVITESTGAQTASWITPRPC